jgi:glucose-1-phosphate adenylyltransferase
VRVNSFCQIDSAVILPGVRVGRHCRLKNVVIDRGCHIPEGLVVGEDAVADAARFERSEGGVVLITREMLKRLEV